MNIILTIIVIIVLVSIVARFMAEGFHPISNNNTSLQGGIQDYYLWRAYQSNPYDQKQLMRFPYTYQPFEHPAEFNRYLPYFYEYGYGSF